MCFKFPVINIRTRILNLSNGSALLGLLSEWQAQLTVKSPTTPDSLFWAVHSTDSFYHLMQEIKCPFCPWTIPELLHRSKQVVSLFRGSQSLTLQWHLTKSILTWLWFPPWQEGNTSEEFSELLFCTSPVMLILLPLVKRDGHILFNASCKVFLKETEAKVTRRKAAALRLELVFGLETQLYTAFFLLFLLCPFTVHVNIQYL